MKSFEVITANSQSERQVTRAVRFLFSSRALSPKTFPVSKVQMALNGHKSLSFCTIFHFCFFFFLKESFLRNVFTIVIDVADIFVVFEYNSGFSGIEICTVPESMM
eukprot:CAMPEP_0168326366 /NCGR_PEP_ID=MMETSP0213-20121227/5253_1 /TAXON_ID=151035 /ORGANISM="Euplotes harpa, Strain FSP1.4" /LENGTH=105 /DNA_ID=CAMNT_0008329053 /DNA_START=1321 /DNA_END=1638 /DNA_ORIENTATION=-